MPDRYYEEGREDYTADRTTTAAEYEAAIRLELGRELEARIRSMVNGWRDAQVDDLTEHFEDDQEPDDYDYSQGRPWSEVVAENERYQRWAAHVLGEWAKYPHIKEMGDLMEIRPDLKNDRAMLVAEVPA
jgi:hypothetical protein